MQAPPPGRRASRHRRGFRSEGSPCADESTVALRLSAPAGELRIRVHERPLARPRAVLGSENHRFTTAARFYKPLLDPLSYGGSRTSVGAARPGGAGPAPPRFR